MSNEKLEIPPPRADRPPIRVNVFEAMQHSNTQLMPLFPYLHPGAMVPVFRPADWRSERRLRTFLPSQYAARDRTSD